MNPLSQYIREHSEPLQPVPSGEAPQLRQFEGIRAVVFDIYGTLLISGADDGSLADENRSGEAIRSAIESVTALTLAPEAAGLAGAYDELIREARAAARRGESGVDHPEVEIREIWRDLIAGLRDSGVIEGDSTSPQTIERIAVAFECAAHPVWPMPGLAGVVDTLRGRGMSLGIISNAQFYTPLAFPALLGGRDLESLGFEKSLQVYSFQHRIGKPSPRIFEISAERLAGRGIAREQVLYVGNDRLKDVGPAAAVGFRTALFAGDRRSLRWREEDPRVAEVVPDLVITDLRQVLDCLS